MHKFFHGCLLLMIYRAVNSYISTNPPNIRHLPGAVSEEPSFIGNAEFNAGTKKSKFAYPILELYKLNQTIKLEETKSK